MQKKEAMMQAEGNEALSTLRKWAALVLEAAQNEKGMGIRMKKVKNWLFFIGFILLLSGTLVLGFRIGKGPKGSDKKTVFSQSVLEQKMEEAGELATVKYYYTDMGKYDSSKLIGDVKIPFTTTSFIITFDGIIKAGVDLKQADVRLEGSEVTVTLPPSRILSNEIKEDSTLVYDEKNSIFNGLSVADVTNFQSEQKKQMEEKAIENGLLKEADEKARNLLMSFWNSMMEGGNADKPYTLKVVMESEEGDDAGTALEQETEAPEE